MVFFLDLDIFSMRPVVTARPVARSVPPSISSGDNQRPSSDLYVSCVTIPCVNSPAKGSAMSSIPICLSARVQKRAYSRCRIACSTPPIYWFTGSHCSAPARSNGLASGWLAKRMKYQLESTKVSSVSVSRTASAPQDGQATCFHVGCRSSGLPGMSKDTSSGRMTGNWSAGTGTTPHAAQ